MSKKQLFGVMICLASFVYTSGFSDYPQKHNRKYYELRGEAVWEVPTDEKLISLTFDDGPNSRMTPLILDILKQYDAKATFFVVGNRISKNMDIIKREVAEGHEVANHTYNHILFTQNHSIESINREMIKTKELIEMVAGQDSPWFRPPGGNINDSVIKAAKDNGYTVVLWSWHQDTKDWRAPGVDAIVQKVLKNARNGDIVLMHDNVQGSDQTYKALKKILPELQRRGFRFVTISELGNHRRSSKSLRQQQPEIDNSVNKSG
ncbi:polysaccharide deacetylase family protein [Paenibacillus sp. HB172176]|uniref:polysaccharide deacetylase family protein n=1 Tax=Paenibacillus sp. HB172176 TaxID=2493690 RepID=UPI001F0DCEC5|nr:polysaccharide deacetylase family protein [Paenibacillus sp. HB172176]